jgi:hypothetical protein
MFDECTDSYAAELLVCCLVLALFGLASLIYSARVARRTLLGDELLDACKDDYQTAYIACANVRAENEHMDRVLRGNMRRPK